MVSRTSSGSQWTLSKSHNYFDDTADPEADVGITSVISTGQHFRESNVDAERRWIETERFWKNGVEVIRFKGDLVKGSLGKPILDFRDDHPALFRYMKEDLNFRFYQQDAGFEDSQITQWKIEEQSKSYGGPIALRDLFNGVQG